MPSVQIVITDIGGNTVSSYDCISLRFEKEFYTPYTSLSAVFSIRTEVNNLKDVMLYIDGKCIHHGLIDSADFRTEANRILIKLISKGFTSMLLQNQLEPGLKPNISLNSLMDSLIAVPYVTHEDNSDTQNYIYVKENSSMWDAVANLCFKLNGGYPYIDGTNNVRITPKSSAVNVNLTSDIMLSHGIVNDYTKIISDYHMKDINDTYSTYNLSNPDAYSRNIVRHKHIDLDKQYLNNPQNALVYRIAYGMRSFFSCYGEYQGYNGEDLCDSLTINGIISNAHINRLVITGNAQGITTKCFAYYDSFCN